MSFWEELTDGLQMHEVLLFVLGSLLFLVLVFLVVLYAMRKENIRGLLLFFVVPVVMIGWPSIAKVQVSAAGIALENAIRDYETAPGSVEAHETLQASVEALESKGVRNPETLVNIARAKYILGRDHDALKTIDEIPGDMRAAVGAVDLKKTITVTQDIQRKLQQAEQAPTADNLEILRISKDQLRNRAANNVRLRHYVTKSDSLIQKEQ